MEISSERKKKIIYTVFLCVLVLFCIEISLHVLAFFLYRNDWRVNTMQFVPAVGCLYLNAPTANSYVRSDQVTMKDFILYTENAFDKAPQIWVFGGSCVGSERYSGPKRTGSLVSEFSRTLSRHGKKYTVINFGQSSFAINDERILFSELLRNKVKPAIVIFYDGFNECPSGYPMNYVHYKKLTCGVPTAYSFKRDLYKKRIKLFFLIDQLVNVRDFFVRDDYPFFIKGEHFKLGKDGGGAFNDVLKNYKFNVAMIEAICRPYGIKPYFFWQPYIGTKQHLTEQEKTDLKLLAVKGMRPDPRADYERIRKDRELARMPNFFYAADVFREHTGTIYLDDCHIDQTYDGHRIIARYLYDKIFLQKGR